MAYRDTHEHENEFSYKIKRLMPISIVLATIFLTAIGIACIVHPPKNLGVIIYAFDQNPAGSNEGNEWVTIHNPSNESVEIGNWTFESIHSTTAIDWIPEGTTPYPGAYCAGTPFIGGLTIAKKR